LDFESPFGADDFDSPASEVRLLVPASSVPRVAMTAPSLRTLPLDGTAGYVLSLVDGCSSVETIFDICAHDLTRAEVLDILARLVQLGAIVLRDP
jgi:hypothetical protein